MILPAAVHLLPIGQMARALRVPVAWLRQESEAGRIPHLKAGRQLLFHPETVRLVLAERAKGPAAHPELKEASRAAV
jgi:hypothetical protein